MTPLVDLREVFVVHPSEDGGVAALRGLTLRSTAASCASCSARAAPASRRSCVSSPVSSGRRPGAPSSTGSTSAPPPGTSSPGIAPGSIGYADQHYWRALSADLTAEALVALPLGLRGVPSPERTRRARDLLERVDLLDRADARPGELSGGEQQRIALCAALAPSPALLVADEPTGELDEDSAHVVLDLLAALAREEGASALVVSHDPASASIADRVVHVRDGRVGEERTGDEETIVIGRGGWLRVPEDSLRTAGIGDRAVVRVRPGVVELRPTGGDAAVEPVVHESPLTAAGVLVEARGVTRRYGHEVALERFDGVFSPGTLTAVTGPSGSGKSTLLALLAGLDTPDEGRSSSTARSCRHSTVTGGRPSAAIASASLARCPASPACSPPARTSSSR